MGPYLSEEEEIYNSPLWYARRRAMGEYQNWYSGAALTEKSVYSSDVDTSESDMLYPLEVNPISKVCRVHRNVMLGMVDEYVSMPVNISFARPEESETDIARESEQFLEDVFYDSDMLSLINQAALRMQVDGGRVFAVRWEPYNRQLRHRIRLLSYPLAYFDAVYDYGDYYDLLEARIGYMLDARVAVTKYGIPFEGDPDEWDTVLYMERWTRDTYRTTVHGYVPSIDGYSFEGKNPYGIVPIVYIPRERDEGFWGSSHVPSLIALTREKNERLADWGDAVDTATHPTLWMANTNVPPKEQTLERDRNRNPIKKAIHIGSARAMPNSKEPKLQYASAPNITAAVDTFSSALNNEIRQQSDVAPVATGDDDTSSGRITGPVTAYRLWPTMAHTQSERVDFSAGLVHLCDIMMTVALVRGQDGSYQQIGIDAPEIDEELIFSRRNVTWPPQIPIQIAEKSQGLTSRLQAGGISLQSYLEQLGEKDVAEEMGRIESDKMRGVEMQVEAMQAKAETQEPEDREGEDQENGR